VLGLPKGPKPLELGFFLVRFLVWFGFFQMGPRDTDSL